MRDSEKEKLSFIGGAMIWQKNNPKLGCRFQGLVPAENPILFLVALAQQFRNALFELLCLVVPLDIFITRSSVNLPEILSQEALIKDNFENI